MTCIPSPWLRSGIVRRALTTRTHGSGSESLTVRGTREHGVVDHLSPPIYV